MSQGSFEKAQHLMLIGRMEHAELEIVKGLQSAPGDPWLLGLLAQVQAGSRIGPALISINTALAAAPDDVWLLQVASSINLINGRNATAIQLAERAVLLEPNSLPALLALVEALSRSDRRTDEALALAQEAVRLAPHSPAAWNAMGLANLARNDRRSAEASYRQALSLDPTNDTARQFLSFTHETSGRLVDATLLLEQLVRENPTDLESRTRIESIAVDVLADLLWLALPVAFLLAILMDGITGAFYK